MNNLTEDFIAIEEMEKRHKSFMQEYGRLPRTGEEDPWVDEFGDFTPELRRHAQRFTSGS